MPRFLILPTLVLVLGCGSSKLSRSEAERDIRADYPVIVDIRVPEATSAIKGSPEHAKLVSMLEPLSKTGWFSVDRETEGDRERIRIKPNPSAPTFIRTTPTGFSIPAAAAEFVRALRQESSREGLRVTYQIRLTRPTAQFGLFQALHPEVKIGDTKERHATYRREGRSWILQGTDEVFKKAD